MDLVGEINRLAGVAVVDRLGFAGACNLWAGTTGLEAVGALNVKAGLVPNGTALELNGVLKRLGFDLDSNGALVGATDGTTNVANVLRLPGVFNNLFSTPDTAAVSITGDIDIRVKVALDDWTPSITNVLIAKRGTAGQRSWYFYVQTNGILGFGISLDGTAESFLNAPAATGFADGTVGWVRVTRASASGNTLFYTSTDGVSWTQIGGTVGSTAGGLFDNTADVRVGARDGGSEPSLGYLYYAELRNGIAGTVVASFDATAVAVRGDRLPTTVNSVPFNLLTANQADVETDTTGFTASGTTLLRSTSTFNTGAASLEVTTGAGANPSVFLGGATLGTFAFPVTPGQTYSFVYSLKAATAGIGSQHKIDWYSAAGSFLSRASGSFTDTTSWVQHTLTGVAPALAAWGVPVITFTGTPGAGLVHNLDTMALYQGTVAYWTPPTTWTVNGTAWWWDVYSGTKLRTNSLRLPGVAGSYVSTPDSASLSITGDIDLRAKVALDDWTPATDQALIAKFVTGTNDRSYYLNVVTTTGVLNFRSSTTGASATINALSTVAPTVADGAILWVRATLAVATGTVTFYTSADNVTWTPLGSTVVQGATSIFDSIAPVEIGSFNAGSAAVLSGRVYYAEVRNGIGGTVVGAFNPDALRITGPQTPSSWTGSAGNVWTINGTGWAWQTS